MGHARAVDEAAFREIDVQDLHSPGPSRQLLGLDDLEVQGVGRRAALRFEADQILAQTSRAAGQGVDHGDADIPDLSVNVDIAVNGHPAPVERIGILQQGLDLRRLYQTGGCSGLGLQAAARSRVAIITV